MARIEVSTHSEAPPTRVWQVLVDWESQPRWMVDARSVTVLTPTRAGTGVVLRCETDILAGLVVTDDMVVTEWRPPRSLAVRHLGRLIRGVGAFELEPAAEGTHITWWEEVEAPFGGVGDAVAQVLVLPRTRRLFQASLANLARVAEARTAAPRGKAR